MDSGVVSLSDPVQGPVIYYTTELVFLSDIKEGCSIGSFAGADFPWFNMSITYCIVAINPDRKSWNNAL